MSDPLGTRRSLSLAREPRIDVRIAIPRKSAIHLDAAGLVLTSAGMGEPSNPRPWPPLHASLLILQLRAFEEPNARVSCFVQTGAGVALDCLGQFPDLRVHL